MTAWPAIDATWARLRAWWRRLNDPLPDEATRLEIFRCLVSAPGDPIIRPIGRGQRAVMTPNAARKKYFSMSSLD